MSFSLASSAPRGYHRGCLASGVRGWPSSAPELVPGASDDGGCMIDENLPRPDGILPGEAPANSGVPSTKRRSWLPAVLVCLTLSGLACVIVGLNAGGYGGSDVLQYALLAGGALLSLTAGISWTHSRGWRILKALCLGAIGAVSGAIAGACLGVAMGPNNGMAGINDRIILGLCGLSLGAILFGLLGLWWGLRFHRVFRSGQEADPNVHLPESRA